MLLASILGFILASIVLPQFRFCDSGLRSSCFSASFLSAPISPAIGLCFGFVIGFVLESVSAGGLLICVSDPTHIQLKHGLLCSFETSRKRFGALLADDDSVRQKECVPGVVQGHKFYAGHRATSGKIKGNHVFLESFGSLSP